MAKKKTPTDFIQEGTGDEPKDLKRFETKKPGRPRQKDGKKRTLYISKDLWTKLRIHSAIKDTSVSYTVELACKEYLSKYGEQ